MSEITKINLCTFANEMICMWSQKINESAPLHFNIWYSYFCQWQQTTEFCLLSIAKVNYRLKFKMVFIQHIKYRWKRFRKCGKKANPKIDFDWSRKIVISLFISFATFFFLISSFLCAVVAIVYVHLYHVNIRLFSANAVLHDSLFFQ